jgi:hypothetical protein
VHACPCSLRATLLKNEVSVTALVQELYSYGILHEVINWSSIALHVPPAQMPGLDSILAAANIQALRQASTTMRRRLLWTSIYGPCHFRDGEGGRADAYVPHNCMLAALMYERCGRSACASEADFAIVHVAEPGFWCCGRFDTLMQVLAIPRRHFRLTADHTSPRAPEMMDELNPWLKKRGGELCTHGYQCFDQWRRSCFEKYS